MHKFTVPEVHFHAQSIGASPVVIACKTAKLFKFLHLQTQRDPTIIILCTDVTASAVVACVVVY